MILPEGNNKKYIKVVIGIFILFTILSPVLSNFSSANFDFKDAINQLEQNMSQSKSTNARQSDLQEANNQSIEEIYQKEMKSDITNKVKSKGYEATNIQIEADLKEGSNTYGKINKISLTLKRKVETSEEENRNTVNETENEITQVNQVEIGKVEIKNQTTMEENKEQDENTENSSSTSKSKPTIFEVNDIKKYLNETYEVDIKNIQIHT